MGVEAVHGNPYDGKTLSGALCQTEKLTNTKPKQASVDKGFRGQEYHPPDVEVLVAGSRGSKEATPKVKRYLKRRSAIEPIIGHTKQDHALKRNYLRGQVGDRMNAILAGCGFNLRKLLHFLTSVPLLRTQTNT